MANNMIRKLKMFNIEFNLSKGASRPEEYCTDYAFKRTAIVSKPCKKPFFVFKYQKYGSYCNA